MPQGFRDGTFALGLIVGFAGTLLLVLFVSPWWSQAPGPDASSYAQEQCERQQQGQSPLPSPAIDQSEGAGTGKTNGNEEKEESYRPDWCDLAAQQAAAQASVRMERSTFWTVILTAAGLLLIGGTLYYTHQNNVIARTAAEIDQRPWVSVGIPELTEYPRIAGDGLWLHFSVELRNSGKTPAIGCQMRQFAGHIAGNFSDIAAVDREFVLKAEDRYAIAPGATTLHRFTASPLVGVPPRNGRVRNAVTIGVAISIGYTGRGIKTRAVTSDTFILVAIRDSREHNVMPAADVWEIIDGAVEFRFRRVSSEMT